MSAATYGPGDRDKEGRIFGPSSDYLLTNDWLSSLIGALLCRLGCGRGALWDHALPGSLLGGAEVVRRFAWHKIKKRPMPKPKRSLNERPAPLHDPLAKQKLAAGWRPHLQ